MLCNLGNIFLILSACNCCFVCKFFLSVLVGGTSHSVPVLLMHDFPFSISSLSVTCGADLESFSYLMIPAIQVNVNSWTKTVKSGDEKQTFDDSGNEACFLKLF